MNLLSRFQLIIKEQNLFSRKDKLLLAVSGGVDSVVLCELCKQADFDFEIAHCNFQLRGEESERDEQFVKELGKKYAIRVLVKKFETENYSRENKISIQEAARELRYEWFSEIINGQWAMDKKQYAIINEGLTLEELNCQLPIANWLLTAHHADDNAETVVMNFFRGTGLHGLTGIPVKNGFIRRPLLEFPKEALMVFANEHGLEFVEDSSNQSLKYTRNFFRNELFPAISTVYPQVKDNLGNSIARFKEIERFYQYSVGELKKKLCHQKGNEIHIPVKQLMAFQNKALIYEIISEYGFQEKQVEELVKLAQSESGKYILSPDHHFRIIRHRHWFIVSPVQSVNSEHILIEEGISNMQFAIGNLQISRITLADCQLPIANSIACLDIKEIRFPLLLRKWKSGDYFYPLGMKKKKKLARFFIDQKLSKTEKEGVWVIETEQKIIWVVGYRIDDRFKVLPSTSSILELTIHPPAR